MSEFNPAEQLNNTRRAEFSSLHLSDFDLDVTMLFHTWDAAHNPGTIVMALRRNEVQKLFDELWKYSFRPTDK